MGEVGHKGAGAMASGRKRHVDWMALSGGESGPRWERLVELVAINDNVEPADACGRLMGRQAG